MFIYSSLNILEAHIVRNFSSFRIKKFLQKFTSDPGGHQYLWKVQSMYQTADSWPSQDLSVTRLMHTVRGSLQQNDKGA
jgi:hypothetical protein